MAIGGNSCISVAPHLLDKGELLAIGNNRLRHGSRSGFRIELDEMAS